MQTRSQNANPYTHVSNAENVPANSAVQSIEIQDENGTVIPVTETLMPIRIVIPRAVDDIEVNGQQHCVTSCTALFFCVLFSVLAVLRAQHNLEYTLVCT